MAVAKREPVTGSFTGADTSLAFVTAGGFNLSLSGFGTATVQLQRSFNKGSTWKVVESYTSDTEKRCDDPEVGVWYRFQCTDYTSGPIVYRISS